VLLNGNGRLKVTQGEFEHELAPGDGIIFDAVHAHAGQCLVESDTWVIQVPDVLLKTLRAADAANNTTLLRKNAAITRMMTSVISAYHTLNDEERAETGFITGQYLADLVALSLGTNRDGTASIEQRGLRAARVQAVFDDIGRHYLSASSSAQDSASRLGISTRYLHLLLERTGKSYSDHVLDRRLVLARRILLDRNKSHMRIIDIAHGCGFADLSYFNRTYRRRFAETPSDTRALSGG
jgi:AraC-like DNA-binding protein